MAPRAASEARMLEEQGMCRCVLVNGATLIFEAGRVRTEVGVARSRLCDSGELKADT